MVRLALLLPLVLAAVRAEIIDRIAVVVGSSVITASELERELRLTAFLNSEKLNLGPQEKRKAADRLVEQRLIRREMELNRYPTPDPAQADRLLEDIKKTRFTGQAQYEQALKEYGLTETELKAHLFWQLTTLQFIDLRFRPGIQISEEEIEQEFARRHPQAGLNSAARPVSLDERRAKIEEELLQLRLDQYLDQWLKSGRERTRIEFRTEVFR
jgi:peptidyl-prolyl cis-trans isomerase SurA